VTTSFEFHFVTMGKCGQCGRFFNRLDSHKRTSKECGDPTGAYEEESSVEESFVHDDLGGVEEVSMGYEEFLTESDGHADRPNQHETIGNATRRQNLIENSGYVEGLAAPDDHTASRYQNMNTEDVDDLIENFVSDVSINAGVNQRTRRRTCVHSSTVALVEAAGRSRLRTGSVSTSFPNIAAPTETLGRSETSRIQQRSDSLPYADDQTETEQPANALQNDQTEVEEVENDGLQNGEPFRVPNDFDSGRFCFPNKDCAMMRIYHICDEAKTPRWLADKIMAQVKTEMQRNDFDPCDPSITKRDAFMARMHLKFPSPKAEAIQVELESFDHEVTLYRFDLVKQLQDHLLRADLYREIKKLNVNQENRWDQTCPPPFKHYNEVTDGTWYKAAVKEHINRTPITPPADLEDTNTQIEVDRFIRFLITLELYTDSTGTDQKESFSLEPVLMSTGLLHSEFAGMPASRFIVGYIPCLSNLKSSAAQAKKHSTVGGFGSNVRDYHKCLGILLEPLVLAQKKPPLMTVVLGDQVRKVRVVLLMGPILGDGKSQDMICCRVMSNSKTLRLSRGTLTPSCLASDTSQTTKWIKSGVIHRLTRGALFSKCTGSDRADWNTFMRLQGTEAIKKKYVAASRRREKICTSILRFALRSHTAINAFSRLDMASDLGVYGHTLADVMHLLEEGIFKYLEFVLLVPLSDTVLAEIDKLVEELFGPEANRCAGSKEYPRFNFTRGFTRLTLLSSTERVGVLIVIVILLRTERGRKLFQPRFEVGFDKRRKERAAKFKKTEEVADAESQAVESLGRDDVGMDEGAEVEDPTVELNGAYEATVQLDGRRTKKFEPTPDNIDYVCRHIENHDLGFLLTDVFPELPDAHVYKCLEVTWEVVFSVRDGEAQQLKLPKDALDHPKYEPDTYQPGVRGPQEKSNSTNEKVSHSFNDRKNRGMPIPVDDNGEPFAIEGTEEQPTITQDSNQFLECCELLLALRSFYNYAGSHCHESIPMSGNTAMDLAKVKERTKHVADSLKMAVNRGEGTCRWNIPKFIDLMLLPEYMHFMGSLGRMHLGWAESGLKTWAKKPANTAQKRKGGVFEKQCACRIRETSMMTHAVGIMETQVDYLEEEEEVHMDDGTVGGAVFEVDIVQEHVRTNEGTRRTKSAIYTRFDGNRKVHGQQIELNPGIISYIKTKGKIGEKFEVRTEAVIGGIRYRAHPKYRGVRPHYDFVRVKFTNEEDDRGVNPLFYPDDGFEYPAKLVGIFRQLPTAGITPNLPELSSDDYFVIAQCADFQEWDSDVYNRKTLLTRSWLYEMTASNKPRYTSVGTVKGRDLVGHVFAIEERPGFHAVYDNEEERRIIVLSDMRRDWPNVFVHGNVV
jgi:hypothetical protein